MKKLLDDKIKSILHYVGIIGAVLSCIVYFIIVLIMVQGFNADADIRNTILFAVINAVMGLAICQLLKTQGIELAKMENEELLKLYYGTKTKDKKYHTMRYFWVTSVIKDVLFKGISIGISTFGVIYVVIQGTKDYHMLLLALSNVIMFICFGLLAMNKSYDYFNNIYVNYLKQSLEDNQC